MDNVFPLQKVLLFFSPFPKDLICQVSHKSVVQDIYMKWPLFFTGVSLTSWISAIYIVMIVGLISVDSSSLEGLSYHAYDAFVKSSNVTSFSKGKIRKNVRLNNKCLMGFTTGGGSFGFFKKFQIILSIISVSLFTSEGGSHR